METFTYKLGHVRLYLNLHDNVGQVEELAEEELEGVGDVGTPVQLPITDNVVELLLLLRLIQKRLL